MNMLWKVAKVVLVLAIGIPLAIIVLSTALGLLGALVGLAFMVLRLAIIGLVLYGGFRIAAALFGWRRSPSTPVVKQLPPVDPYYAAAERELDQEIGGSR